MKTIQFAIMLVLMLGLAASPALQTGFAYAQQENATDANADDPVNREVDRQTPRNGTSGDRDTERNVDRPTPGNRTSIDRSAIEPRNESSNQARDYTTLPHYTIGPENGTSGNRDVYLIQTDRDVDRVTTDDRRAELQEQRRASMDNKMGQLQDRFANMSAERQQNISDRLQAMHQQRDTITPSVERTTMMNMTSEERQVFVQQMREDRAAELQVQQNMSPEDITALLEQQRADMVERRANSVSPRDQLGLGASPDQVICLEGYEVILKVSDGLPNCVASYTAAILVDRGFATYPEE